MRDSGYWVVLSVGWDCSRPRGRRWDALVIAVEPTDELGEPDPDALARERPGRVIAWGLWIPMAGWSRAGQVGPARLVERFMALGISEQGPFRAACALGVQAAMRLALGLTPQDRDPFPTPGAN